MYRIGTVAIKTNNFFIDKYNFQIISMQFHVHRSDEV